MPLHRPLEPGLRCLINGEERAAIAVDDRGLAYGDGLFETLAVRDGRPCCWLDHLDRLARGAARLRIPLPSPSRLEADAKQLTTGVDAGTLKIILTRGRSSRGYRPPSAPRPTRALILNDAVAAASHDQANQGARVRLCEARLGINPQLAGIKHLNRLEQVLARSEWADENIDEGLMLDAEGTLVCGTMSNLVLIDEGGLKTPRLDRCGVAGTARARLLQAAAAAGLKVREARCSPAELLRARGALLTNALIGIWPVRAFEGRAFDLAQLPWALIESVRSQLLQPESDW